MRLKKHQLPLPGVANRGEVTFAKEADGVRAAGVILKAEAARTARPGAAQRRFHAIAYIESKACAA